MADAPKIVRGGLSAVRNASRAADEALEARRLAMEAANPPIKASEAYGKHEGAYMKPIFYDRMRVDLSKGKKGGPGFSGIQLVDPNYANAKAAAGVTDQKMATRILNRNKAGVPAGAKVIWTPSVGGLEQHKSNSTMFGEFADIFANQRKNMSAEEIQKLSDRASTMTDNKGRLIFPNGIDLGSRNFRQQVKTYDQRGLMADIFAGRGVGGEKGRTVPMEDLLEKNLDPNVAGAGTLDLGNRLFRLEGNVIDRPDLHSDYRKILTGEDLGVNYIPVPIRDVYSDWEVQKALDLAAQGKNRPVTLMDYTKNDPTVQLTEALLTKMQKAGQKKGGVVRSEESPQDMARFQKRYAMHKAIGGRVQSKPVKMASGGSIFDKPVHMVDGGKIGRGIAGALTKAEEIAKARMAANMAPTARINLPAPGILIPSKINNVREAVRNTKGNYGARRVERAADEIPNLEKMYKEDALKEAFTGENASGVMTMNPADFEKFAIELSKKTSVGPKAAELAKQGEIDKYTLPTDEYIKYLQQVGGFDYLPYLNLFKDEVGLPTKAKIVGHEGRHRSRALADRGDTASLVQLSPRGDLREGMPRRTQEDFIEALKEELDSANRLVLPEVDGSYRRPPVVLPDVYAKGGGVHMIDGGKVAKGLMGAFNKANTAADAAMAEANLKKMLEPSKVQQRLYHGTTATEGGKGKEAIRRLKPSKEGALGSGVYMTPNTPHASSYTGIPNDEAIALMSQGNDYSKKMADQFMADRAAGRLREGQAGGNMLPVYAQLKNPLIIGQSGRNIDPAAEALINLGMDEESAIKLVEKAFEEKGNIGKQIQSRAQAQGYDGIMQYRGGDLSEVVSYNPNAIKSAIGNQGTYDITHPDLSKADGGKIAKGITGALTKAGKAADEAIAARKAPQEDAMRLAQQRAALPPAKGGLGLPANNTPAQREKAMGFNTDVYHGSKQDINKFKNDQPVFAAEDPDIAGLYGNTIYPLKLRGEVLEVSDLGKDGASGRFSNNLAKELKIPRKELEDLRMPQPQFDDSSFLERLESFFTKRFGDPSFSDIGEREMVNKLPKHGIDRLKVTDMSDMGGTQTQHMIPAGSDNIRSRFAAFDPFRKDAATAAAMGVLAPDLLAKEKEDKKAKGGRIEESPEDMARFQKRFAMHKAIGGSVKKPQKFDGGGIAASDVGANTEDKGPTKAGLMAEFLAQMAKDQAKEEYESYKKPRAVTDIGNRGILAPALGAPVDLINMGLMGVDYIGSKATGKPIRLSSEKPFGGQEHLKDLMDKYGVTSGEDRPLTETMLSLFSPTGMIKGAQSATKGAVKAADAMRRPKAGAMREKTN